MSHFRKEEDVFKNWYIQSGESNLKEFHSKFYMDRDYMGRPVCFFEVAQDYDTCDTSYFLTSLPKASIKYPCYLVLYRLDDKAITNLRVKRVFPRERPFEELPPGRFLSMVSAVKRLSSRLYLTEIV